MCTCDWRLAYTKTAVFYLIKILVRAAKIPCFRVFVERLREKEIVKAKSHFCQLTRSFGGSLGTNSGSLVGSHFWLVSWLQSFRRLNDWLPACIAWSATIVVLCVHSSVGLQTCCCVEALSWGMAML